MVGCYVQDAGGVVHVVLRDDPGAEARAALDTEAERLTGWLAGESVNSVYASRQMREAAYGISVIVAGRNAAAPKE